MNIKIKRLLLHSVLGGFDVYIDMCIAPPDKSACRGSHGTEHGAYTWWPASVSKATSASKPMANDQSCDGTYSQPGAVAGQSCTTS